MFDKNNIISSLDNLWKKINHFFRSDQFHRISIFLFFLFLAFCFWLLNTFRNDFTYNYKIPIDIVNLSPEIAITNDIPENIQITILANGYDIFRYNYREGFIPIKIDLSQINDSESSYTILPEQLKTEIKKQFLGNTKLLYLYPEHIQIFYAKKESKQIPVSINGNILPAAQWMLSGDIGIHPNVVTAYGPKEIIDTLQFAQTVFFEKKNLQDTVQKKVTLKKIPGIKFVPDQVTVFIPIEEFTEKSVEVPITGLNIPENLSLRTFPAMVNVSFFVVLSRFNQVSADDFEISVDYIEFERNKLEEKHPLYLSKFPDFVQNIRLNTTAVDILLEEKLNSEK